MKSLHTFCVVFHQDGLLHRFSVHSLHHKAENIMKVNKLELLKPTKIPQPKPALHNFNQRAILETDYWVI